MVRLDEDNELGNPEYPSGMDGVLKIRNEMERKCLSTGLCQFSGDRKNLCKT